MLLILQLFPPVRTVEKNGIPHALSQLRPMFETRDALGGKTRGRLKP